MRGFFVDGKSYCLVFLNQFCATGLIQLFLWLRGCGGRIVHFKNTIRPEGAKQALS